MPVNGAHLQTQPRSRAHLLCHEGHGDGKGCLLLDRQWRRLGLWQLNLLSKGVHPHIGAIPCKQVQCADESSASVVHILLGTAKLSS